MSNAWIALCASGVAMCAGVGLASPARSAVLPSVNARATEEEVTRPPWIPSDSELESSGATVGEIVIEPEDVFDSSVPGDDATLFHLVNRLHVTTRPQTLESQLLFASGSLYSGHALAESERILRSTRYLYDAS